MTLHLPPLHDLVACPECDTLHHASALPDHTRARCQRCGVVLATSRPAALAQVLSLALTAFILMLAAIWFPFIQLNASGNRSTISVIDAALAFDDGLAVFLALAVIAFIVVLPLVRLAAIIYALGPLVRDASPHPHAKWAFALSERLRPWSMAEIFIVGVAVALIKVAGIAQLTLGIAFWAFAGLVVTTVLKDQLLCRYLIWRLLDPKQT